jgi:aminoglycoside phosphotransferase (APT) family kinase protein
VAGGARRDDAALIEGLGGWMAAHPDLVPGAVPDGPRLRIESLWHAEGGLANETLLVALAPDHPGIVVRLPPLDATYENYDLAPQAVVQNAVAAAGLPAPAPAVAVSDARWIGSPFLVMPRISGPIPGPAPLFDPWIADATAGAQRKVHDALVDVLAAVHAVKWSASHVGDVLPTRSVGAALEHWTGYVRWAGEGDPLPDLVAALEWCRQHQPAERGGPAPVLLWGDPRLGNLVFDDDRNVRAVLDWDLASIGPPEMDLGWFFGLEYMMDSLFGARVPGFPDRAEALVGYEARSGHAVRDLGWHEVFAMTRALAINDRHQRIAGSSRRRENPMAGVLRARMAEVDGGSGSG